MIDANTSTPTARNYERALRAQWMQLEDYRAMKPLPAGRCRACGAFQAPASLCLDCNDTRLRLKERFHLFPIPDDTVETLAQLEAVKPEAEQPRIAVGERPYRKPYKDPED